MKLLCTIALLVLRHLHLISASDYCPHNGTTCIINSSITVLTVLVIDFKGDILVTGAGTCLTGNSLHIEATGSLRFESQSRAIARFGSIVLNGSAVSVVDKTSISAYSDIQILARAAQAQHLQISDGSSNSGHILIEGGSQIQCSAAHLKASQGISIVGPGTALTGTSLRIAATGSLKFENQSRLEAKSGGILLNGSAVSVVGKTSIKAYSDIQILAHAAKAQLLRTSDGFLRISDASTNSGDILIEGGSEIQADVAKLGASRSISIKGTSLTARTSIAICGYVDQATCAAGINLRDVKLESPSVVLDCNGSSVNIQGASTLGASDHTKAGPVNLTGKSISVEETVVVVARSVSVCASEQVTFSPVLWSAQFAWEHATSSFVQLQLTSQGSMVLGNENSTWRVSKLFASSKSLKVSDSSRIYTEGDSTCGNHGGSAVEDICSSALSSWPSWPGAWPQPTGRSQTAGGTENLTFDLVLLARAALELGTGVVLAPAASLLCAGGEAIMMDDTSIDASMRGCGQGQSPSGFSHSLPPSTWDDQVCGGAGGSHVGQGGRGSKFDSSTLTACRSPAPGEAYDRYDQNQEFLPTQGAGGGASGRKTMRNAFVDGQHASSGGGLIWLSGAGGLSFGRQTSLKADGASGSVEDGKFVSGGGAGGQVFIFVQDFIKTLGDFSISAAGGSIGCIHGSTGAAGGGGGGGFVGLHWTQKPSMQELEVIVHEWKDHVSVNVAGGGLGTKGPQGCDGWKNQEAAFGEDGLALSIINCAPGESGMLCAQCSAGNWSTGGSEPCRPCTNKPIGKGNYTKAGWYNKDCPYTCGVGLPNVLSNPKCLDPFDYALRFFGGTHGVLAIASGVFLVAVCLLLRSPHRKQRRRQLVDSQSCLQTASSSCNWAFCCLEGGRGCCGSHPARSIDGATRTHGHNEFEIPRERLKTHLTRVYFHGENREKSPWHLDSRLPVAIKQHVELRGWEKLANELKTLAEISRSQARTEAILRAVYPPLAPLYSRWLRAKRARRLRSHVHEFSEKERFFKNLKRELSMSFGCDSSATLGHLDFFDSRQDPFDWQPVSVRGEPWLLPAHGHGTYTDPWEIDIGDPLYNVGEDLRQAAVISTFNRIARVLTQVEIRDSGFVASLQRLHDKVEQSARRSGLGGKVQVVVTSHRQERSELAGQQAMLRMNQLTHSSDADVGADLGRPRVGSSGSGGSVTCQHEDSFSDLRTDAVDPRRVVRQQDQIPTSVSELSSGDNIRICLAFTNSIVSSKFNDGVSSASSTCSSSGKLLCLPALTTPLPREGSPEYSQYYKALRDVLCELSQFGAGRSSQLSQENREDGRQLRRLLLSWRDNSNDGRPEVALLTVVLLLAFDFMAFVLFFWILYKSSSVACMVWMFLPPLTQPLALCLGLAFLFSEDPALGRLFACMELFGIVNALLAFLVLVVLLLVESLVFDIIAVGTVSVAKCALFAAASAHVVNLEAARDFQADFVDNIFSDHGVEENDDENAPSPRRISEDGFLPEWQRPTSRGCSFRRESGSADNLDSGGFSQRRDTHQAHPF
eukprot:TRINITY_DN1499_c0_g1_i1.p1 TRINITY_DN1499_c0_g1~~TRINITY_DN1499_c0_g1_i1.p1  ORF type:complete len:1546 (-),score=206.88 TRINITY_DN1499_c0_g1_i1:109-4746(-)